MADRSQTARLSTVTAVTAMQIACEQAGLDPADAELMRLGENALYVLPVDGVVVRVARSVELVERVAREVRTAAWLAELDFPAVRLAAGLPQVIEADGRLVTFWELVPDTGQAATPADLGAILRDLHQLPTPPFDLPVFDPLIGVPRRLANAADVDPGDLAFLAELCDRLADEYRRLSFALPPGFIHGDAHRANLIVATDRVVIGDFEWVAIGPREWDLTPTVLAAQRFRLPASEYGDFVAAYGFDVTGWDGFPTMRAIRELTMTTWLMQNVAESSDIAAEFRMRVDSLREGDHARTWHAF